MVEGMKRRGVVLASLIRFKQICNHPSQWLGDGVWSEADSRKLTRLREIVDVIQPSRAAGHRQSTRNPHSKGLYTIKNTESQKVDSEILKSESAITASVSLIVNGPG